MSSPQNSSTPVINLRDYQVEAVTALRENRRGIIAAATGAGKTTIMAASISEKASKGKILVLVHLVKLVEQTAERIAKETGLEVGQYYQSKKDDFDLFPVMVATWQSLSQRNEEAPLPRDYFYSIAVDEAHHVSGVFYDLVTYFTPEYLHGFTATPYGRGEEVIFSLFENVIFTIDLFDLIKQKWLTPFTIELFDVSRKKLIESRIVEYNRTKMSHIQKLCRKLRHDGRPVKIVHFFPNKTRIQEFERSNPEAKSVTIASGISAAKRSRRFEQFEMRTSEIEHLYSIRILNEGVDIPIINGLVFHEQTGTLRTFVQRLGRGLRIDDDPKAITYVQQYLEDDNDEAMEILDRFLGEVQDSLRNHKDDEDQTVLDAIHIVPNNGVSRLLAEYRKKCAEREKSERLVGKLCKKCGAQIFKRAIDVERLRSTDGFVCANCQDGLKRVYFKCSECDAMSLMSPDIYFSNLAKKTPLRCADHSRASREESKLFTCSEPGCGNQFKLIASRYRVVLAKGGKLYCDEHRRRIKPFTEVTCSVDGCGKTFSLATPEYRVKMARGHKFYCSEHKKKGKALIHVSCVEPGCGEVFTVDKMTYAIYQRQSTPFRCEIHKRRILRKATPVEIKCAEPSCQTMLEIRPGDLRARQKATKGEPRFFCDEHNPRLNRKRERGIAHHES